MYMMLARDAAVLAAGAAAAASLLVIANRRCQRNEDAARAPFKRGKPPTGDKLMETPPSLETPTRRRAETPRKALLGGDEEHWDEREEHWDEHGQSRDRPHTPPPLMRCELAEAKEALPRTTAEEASGGGGALRECSEGGVAAVARLKAQVAQLAFENESLHNLNESLHKAAKAAGRHAWPELTGATEEDSSVDRAPLATTRPPTASFAADQLTATASSRPPVGLAVPQVVERLFRTHERAARRSALRLCLCAMRQFAQRRTAERRFQGLLTLQRGEAEDAGAEARAEARAEREAESDSRWGGMLERLAHVHEELRAAQLQAAEAAYEARLHEHETQLGHELGAVEAMLLSSGARHAEQLRQQRRCMLAAVGCLLARRRLVLAPRDVGPAYAPYAAQSAATGLRSEGGWADGFGAR